VTDLMPASIRTPVERVVVGGAPRAVTLWACIRRTKSMRLRPHALTEWFENSATQAEGTIASAVADQFSAVASRARDRKASTLSAAATFEEVTALGYEESGVWDGREQDQEVGVGSGGVSRHGIVARWMEPEADYGERSSGSTRLNFRCSLFVSSGRRSTGTWRRSRTGGMC
jgi:hypothetical protein